MSDTPQMSLERCDECGTPLMLDRTYCFTCGKRYSKMRLGGPASARPSDPESTGPGGPESTGPGGPASGPRPDQPAAPPLQPAWEFPPPPSSSEGAAAGIQGGRPAVAMAIAIGLTVALIAGGLVFAFRSGKTTSAHPALPSGSASPSPAGAPITLALAFDRTRPFRFHLVNTMDATFTVPSEGFQRIILKIDERASLRVLSVDPNGTASVDLTIERGSASVNGRRLSLPPRKTIRLRIAQDGRILSTGGEQVTAPGESNGGVPSIDQFLPLLPPGPVKPGDSWSTNFTLPFPLGGGTLRYHTQNRFVGYQALGGVRAAVIHSQIDVPIKLVIDARRFFEATGGDPSKLPPEAHGTLRYLGTMSGEQESWFDPEGRRAIKTTSHGDLDIRMKVSGYGASQPSEIRFQGTFDTVFENLS